MIRERGNDLRLMCQKLPHCIGSGISYDPRMADIEIENLRGADLVVVDGNATYTCPEGSSVVPVSGSPVQFDNGTFSFSLPVTADRLELTVGAASYGLVEGYTFSQSYFMGISMAIPIMFCCLALRAVKQLGYHSQDI